MRDYCSGFYIWGAYRHSRAEFAIPERLKRKKRVRFDEISEALAEAGLGLSERELMRRLVKAVWWGEFENRSGVSRLALPYSSATRQRDDGSWENIDERLEPFNRRDVLSGLPEYRPWIDDYVKEIAPDLKDKDLTWPKLRRKLDFQRIAKLQIPGDYVSSIIAPMTMPRRDLTRWVKRLLDGRYDSEY